MTQPNPSTALARVVVDELARHGVTFIVLSPGSRSGALAIAAAEHEAVSEIVAVDERSAAFHALGRAKATGLPSAVISTSGSAPANFLPAVVEADMSLTPLVVISADRPAEMRGIGANQTIDQVRLFGSKVRYFADVDAPTHHADRNDEWRRTVSVAVSASRGAGATPGPVHLNIAFREPTVPVSNDGRTAAQPYPHDIDGADGGAPWVPHRDDPVPESGIEIPFAPRGLIVAGEGSYDPGSLLAAARSLGWPVAATALSGLRGAGTVSVYHHLLASGVPERLRPEVVVAVGAVGPSRRLEDLISSARLRFRVDPAGRNIDPSGDATEVVHADPVQMLGDVRGPDEEDGWMSGWARLDGEARAAIDGFLDGSSVLSGPGIAAALNEADWDVLVVASSLPIRDVDAHLRRGGRVVANRGASGIDGFVSTSLGVAAAGEATLAVAGDLSFLHDSNGFLIDAGRDLVMIVVDNDGGGLFDLLPQADHAPHFERLFVTPHHRDLRHVADLHGLGYREAGSTPELSEGIAAVGHGDGVRLVRARVDRGHDVAVRRALDEIGAELAGSAQF